MDDSHYECLGFEVQEDSGKKAKVRCKVAWDHPYVRSAIALLSRETAELANPRLSKALYGIVGKPDEVGRAEVEGAEDDVLVEDFIIPGVDEAQGRECEHEEALASKVDLEADTLQPSSTELLLALQED